MQSNNFEVAIDRSRKDSFVTASQSYIDGSLGPVYHGHLPAVVPLRLTLPNNKDVFVGCLIQRAHHKQKMKMFFSLALATDVGLTEGDLVTCAPMAHAPQATKVLVAPLTVDDSEVVEHNALRIEMELLRQVQVVYPSQVITVAIYAGVHARVQVRTIENGEGNELADGNCAVMFEGTHFIVATRARQVASPSAETDTAGEAVKCTWSFLRARPLTATASPAETHADSFFTVDARTAARLGWTAKDRKYQILDLAALATLEDPKITPTFLRSSNGVKEVTLRIRETDSSLGESSADNVAEVSFLSQSTNVLVVPVDAVSKEAAQAEQAALADAGQESDGRNAAAPPPAALPGLTEAPSLEALAAVHGGVPAELLGHLEFVFSQPCAQSSRSAQEQLLSNNVLLCGGKGYGKTTIVASVLQRLRGRVHSVVLECASGKHFLPSLRAALVECVLCAPSVLVLDGFDSIAPDQKEGNAQAMSAATKATLEAVLTTFTNIFSPFARQGTVVVIGTCGNRDDVNEAFRSAWCFQKIIAVNALTRASRCVLLGQMFADASTAELNRMAAFMDNYTPFDVCQIAVRIRNSDSTDGTSLVERTENAAASFTPLAHAGIKFLKGDKLSWDSIGGLTDAKKVLYDTLVLPMRHPKLFAKLPLKTRSGILLYGASGCGKTFVLESLVKAENINCIVVNGPEVFGKYIGQSEQKIRDVFERAAAAAPCVVFFDEFDSVAPQRGVDNSGVTDRVVNQLLCYLDGVEGRKDVYVVAASSRPDLIDAALLRPGRLDKAVQCPVPSLDDRVAILKRLLSNAAVTHLPDALVDKIAAETEHWTPADLSAVVSSASMLVNQRIMDKLANETAGQENLRLGEESRSSYLIADVGRGVSRDKVVDALKALSASGAKASHSPTLSETKMTEDDLVKAMNTTRPSLSAKDIAKQAKIHELFSKGEPLPTPKPGTKLTTN